MSYLRGFVPWIAFGVVSAIGWQWGAAVALVITVTLLATDRRSGVPVDAQILDIGTGVFFAVLAAVAFAAPHSPLQRFDGGLSALWLALIAGVSLAIGRPFTMGVTRRRTPPEFWATPEFRRTNTTITLVWTIGFTVAAIGGFVCDALNGGFLYQVAYTVIGFGPPACFTHRYAARARAARRLAGVR